MLLGTPFALPDLVFHPVMRKMASSVLGCQNKGPDHVQDARFGSSDLTVVTTWNVAAGQAFAMVAAKTDVPAKEDVTTLMRGHMNLKCSIMIMKSMGKWMNIL